MSVCTCGIRQCYNQIELIALFLTLAYGKANEYRLVCGFLSMVFKVDLAVKKWYLHTVASKYSISA